jgi:hypothetical protein
MKIGFSQINATVGDLGGNCELIIGAYERLAAAPAEALRPSLPEITKQNSISP